MTHATLRPSLIALGLFVLPSCAWMPWLGGKKEAARFGVVSVRLNIPPPRGKPIIYAVARVHQGKRLKDAGFQRLSKDGAASFVLPMDHLYDVRIFRDLNDNQSLEDNEPNGLVQNLTPVRPTAAEVQPVTLAFGVIGPVAGTTGAPASSITAPESAAELPAEAEPYLKHVPQWMQDKWLR